MEQTGGISGEFMTCPVCGKAEMKQYGQDSFYTYWKCLDKKCGNEAMQLREDRPNKIATEGGRPTS